MKTTCYGQCLVNAGENFGATFGNCTDSPASSWAYKTKSNGTYQLVNEHTGQCLTSYVGQLVMSDCGSATDQLWRTGSGGTVQSMSSSQCLDESSGWPVTATCESGKATQHWAKD
ncbi:RICIN domain-containing protein [Streptomyces sp. NPDC058256]|uniref:RICIN domain-containing protein n=1 Tax=Streptomyces sp. NPDC058256 TaxID=3346408 RepID=UPI0036EC7150